MKTAYDADICMIDTDLQFNVQCKCESILMNLSESFESLIFGFHVNFSPKNFNQFSTKTISMKLRAYGLRFLIFKAYSAFSLLKIPIKLINGSLKAKMNWKLILIETGIRSQHAVNRHSDEILARQWDNSPYVVFAPNLRTFSFHFILSLMQLTGKPSI